MVQVDLASTVNLLGQSLPELLIACAGVPISSYNIYPLVLLTTFFSFFIIDGK